MTDLFQRLMTTFALIVFLLGLVLTAFGVISFTGFWKYWAIGMVLYVISFLPWMWED